MRQEIREKIRTTYPQKVYDHLFSEEVADINGRIIVRLNGDETKISLVKDVLGLAVLHEIKIEDLAVELAIRLQLPADTARDIALIMLREILFPIGEFFPGIEDAILNLGGEVPSGQVKPFGDQLLVREEEIEEMEEERAAEEAARAADTIVSEDIGKLMEMYPQAGEMLIGSQKAINVKGLGVDMQPMIKYWVRDFREKMGVYRHTNLERVQYVCHDSNTRSMNDEERRQLNLVLKSVDEGLKLPYSTNRGKIDFAQVPDEE